MNKFSRHEEYVPEPDRIKGGYTLPEILVAVALSGLVAIGVLTTFVWCAKQASTCGRSAWSQAAAMQSSFKLQSYLRNASSVEYITNRPNSAAVGLRMPDLSLVSINYTNSPGVLRDGRLYLKRTNGTEMLVVRGMTALQDSGGGTIPVFSMLRTNVIRVAFRISEPVSSENPADDYKYSSTIRFATYLRNAVK